HHLLGGRARPAAPAGTAGRGIGDRGRRRSGHGGGDSRRRRRGSRGPGRARCRPARLPHPPPEPGRRVPGPHRPAPQRRRAVVTPYLIWTELKLLAREPLVLVVSLMFPLLLMVLLLASFGGDNDPVFA